MGLFRRFLNGGMLFRGGLGINVARMCGGIIITAGCEFDPLDICPRGVILRPLIVKYFLVKKMCFDPLVSVDQVTKMAYEHISHCHDFHGASKVRNRMDWIVEGWSSVGMRM